MSQSSYHLAQANYGRMRAPLGDPSMASFLAKLAKINAAADEFPGFVWRLQTEEGDATAVRVFNDDRILFNMSVWESIEALHDYVYRSIHAAPMRDRKMWFEDPDPSHQVLWWIPRGYIPIVKDAVERFELLRRHGPSKDAFTFAKRYPAPDQPA